MSTMTCEVYIIIMCLLEMNKQSKVEKFGQVLVTCQLYPGVQVDDLSPAVCFLMMKPNTVYEPNDKGIVCNANFFC